MTLCFLFLKINFFENYFVNLAIGSNQMIMYNMTFTWDKNRHIRANLTMFISKIDYDSEKGNIETSLKSQRRNWNKTNFWNEIKTLLKD